MSNKLIAFYSRADENYVNGMIKTLELDNTEVAADIIQGITMNASHRHRRINGRTPVPS